MDNSIKPILYVNARQPRSTVPVIDEITRKMAAAFEHRKSGVLWEEFHEGGTWRGVHICVCGATSTANDYLLEAGYITNSLCIHYLAFHRHEVHPTELGLVESLPNEYLDPSTDLLK